MENFIIPGFIVGQLLGIALGLSYTLMKIDPRERKTLVATALRTFSLRVRRDRA